MEFEFIGPNDKPAMALLSTPEWLETTRAVLTELGYKAHSPPTHEEFASRFASIQYQVVVTEVLFAAAVPSENISLMNLQRMPMPLRRHSLLVLIGYEFESLNAMQAFQQSVHVVVNPMELHSLGPIIQQAVAENDIALRVYRDIQSKMAAGKA